MQLQLGDDRVGAVGKLIHGWSIAMQGLAHYSVNANNRCVYIGKAMELWSADL